MTLAVSISTPEVSKLAQDTSAACVKWSHCGFVVQCLDCYVEYMSMVMCSQTNVMASLTLCHCLWGGLSLIFDLWNRSSFSELTSNHRTFGNSVSSTVVYNGWLSSPCMFSMYGNYREW